MTEVKVIWRGKRLNKRMVAMITEAERICPGTYIFGIVQGSYNRGGVSASAGTHDGGGAVDLSIIARTTTQRLNMQLAMRKVGFAAWIRNPNQGNWSWHIHAIAIGDDDMSAGAAYQVRAYKAGLNGLASRGRDTGPSGYRNVTWESYKAAHAVTPKPVPVATGARVSLSNIAYAANGGFFRAGQLVAKNEARAVALWMGRLKIVTDRDIRIWDSHVRTANWKLAGQQYAGMIKKYQSHFHLAVDGKVGPQTKASLSAQLTHYNYRVVA